MPPKATTLHEIHVFDKTQNSNSNFSVLQDYNILHDLEAIRFDLMTNSTETITKSNCEQMPLTLINIMNSVSHFQFPWTTKSAL